MRKKVENWLKEAEARKTLLIGYLHTFEEMTNPSPEREERNEEHETELEALENMIEALENYLGAF